jgi:hypothetical protein
VLFAGHSGDGKSTLAAALMKRGYAMLADDVTGITLDGNGIPTALPAFPCSRLWADVAIKLDYALEDMRQLRLPLEKYAMSAPVFCTEPQPVHAIYCLSPEPQPDISLESVGYLDGFEQIANATYRLSFLDALDVRYPHFQQVMGMAQRVRVRRIKRPSHRFLLDELADRVESEISKLKPMR